MDRRILFVLLFAYVNPGNGLEAASSWGFLGNKTYYPDLANVVFEESDFAKLVESARVGQPGLYPLSWTVPRPGHEHTPCVSPIPRFHNVSCVTIRPDINQFWDQQFPILRPFIDNGTLVGINLGDERMWHGASLQNVSYVAKLIRRDWHNAIIYINEAQDVLMCNFNRLNETIFEEGECFPEELDWFGFDIYSFDNTSPHDSIKAFTDNVFPRFVHGNQRGIPTSTGFGGANGNWTLDQYDENCVAQAETYMEWAEKTPLVGGIFPWHWETYGPITQPYGIGVEDLPKCRAIYNKFGSAVRKQYPRVPAGGRVVPPYRRTCDTPFVSNYAWCDTRH